MQQTWVQSLGWKEPLEWGMASHSSILACRDPWIEEPLQSRRLQRIRHWNKHTNTHTHTIFQKCKHLRRFSNAYFNILFQRLKRIHYVITADNLERYEGDWQEVWGRFKREGIYAHLWLIHVDVWQKSNQYCKAIINQLKKINILKNWTKKRKKFFHSLLWSTQSKALA